MFSKVLLSLRIWLKTGNQACLIVHAFGCYLHYNEILSTLNEDC